LIKKLNVYFYNALYWATAFTAILFFLMVCINVFTRYILKTPFIASIELSRIFFVWSCFLAAAITYYKKGHIVISFMYDKLPDKSKVLLSITVNLLSILFFMLIFIWSTEVVVLIWNTEFPILGISQSWLYIPVPIASLVMFMFSLEFLNENFQHKPGLA
jgi:TRAP-type C4-dicarboxylate transport system permease small subunit